MNAPYYPPTTRLGPPSIECNAMVAWFKGVNGDQVTFLGSTEFREDGTLVFWDDEGREPVDESLVAWLPLVPPEELRDHPCHDMSDVDAGEREVFDPRHCPDNTIVGTPPEKNLEAVVVWGHHGEGPALGRIHQPHDKAVFMFEQMEGGRRLTITLDNIAAWLPLKK